MRVSTMTSFIRISDIPDDELHLLPIIGLREQNRKNRRRFNAPANASDKQEAEAPPQGRAQRAEAAPAEVAPAATGRFVTDWQLHDEPRPSAQFRFDREGRDDDENRTAVEGIDALYVELGGEG